MNWRYDFSEFSLSYVLFHWKLISQLYIWNWIEILKSSSFIHVDVIILGPLAC
jgi:hypothetical protein